MDIISARATTNLAANGTTGDIGSIDLMHIPYYTMISGTSMSAPHVAGIAALMLEANPELNPTDVKRILKETATPMPDRSEWEVGAGYVNAYDAVGQALESSAVQEL